MVALITDSHSIGWVAPAPLWARFGDLSQGVNRQCFARPAILRFSHDAFMDELLALLAYYPEHLDEWLAQNETWEQPMRTPPIVARLDLPQPVSQLKTRLTRGVTEAARAPINVDALSGDLKLYQPVHQRHYLVTASLVCRRTGLPDRRIETARQEQVRFVVRRVLPENDGSSLAEYAYVKQGNAAQWCPVGDRKELLFAGEERLAMFPLSVELDTGRKRTLLGGVIPVGRREAYLSAGLQGTGNGASAAGAAASPADTRVLLLQMQVTGPWSELAGKAMDDIERLLKSAQGLAYDFGDPPASANATAIRRSREQIQTVSWYILLDLTRFLQNQLPRIWRALSDTSARAGLDATTELPLLDYLEQFELMIDKGALVSGTGLATGDVPASLADALRLFAQDPNLATGLEAMDGTYDRTDHASKWPAFLFPLADVGPTSDDVPSRNGYAKTGPFPFDVAGEDLSRGADRDTSLGNVARVLERLETLIEQALPAEASNGMPEIAVPPRNASYTSDARFIIRCVYERPNCGPREPEVLSQPTEPFSMASFFDPEAPARPVRIPMPLDISPAGLRKYSKHASLMISDTLCGQLGRIRKFTLGDLVLSVLPWPFHKDLPDPTPAAGCKDSSGNAVGMFCSLSIPIVTLCALILMIIMVSLFDLFFRWLPYLFLCLPIPGLKGKKS